MRYFIIHAHRLLDPSAADYNDGVRTALLPAGSRSVSSFPHHLARNSAFIATGS